MKQDNASEKIEKANELLEEAYDILNEVHYDYVIPVLETKAGETNKQLYHIINDTLVTAKADIDKMTVLLGTIPLDMVEE